MKRFLKFITDGWLTSGEQVACLPGQIKVFTRCIACGRVFPHWQANMTAAEARKRGRIGCACGGLRIQPVILPGWQSVWWFCIRGWLIRKVILRCRLWDPRMVVAESEEQVVRQAEAAR